MAPCFVTSQTCHIAVASGAAEGPATLSPAVLTCSSGKSSSPTAEGGGSMG